MRLVSTRLSDDIVSLRKSISKRGQGFELFLSRLENTQLTQLTVNFTGCEIDGDGVNEEEECFGYPEAYISLLSFHCI